MSEHFLHTMYSYNPSAVNEKSLSDALCQAEIYEENISILNEMRGGQCQVLEVSCGKEKTKLAIRVPTYMEPGDMVEVLNIEVQNLLLLASKGFLWAPRCYGYSLTFENPMGIPFLVLGQNSTGRESRPSDRSEIVF